MVFASIRESASTAIFLVRARAEIKNLLCEQRAGWRVLASSQPRPQGFSLKKWVWREKALASAGHVSPRTP